MILNMAKVICKEITASPMSSLTPRRKEMAICWTPLPTPSVKINVDGSYKASSIKFVVEVLFVIMWGTSYQTFI